MGKSNTAVATSAAVKVASALAQFVPRVARNITVVLEGDDDIGLSLRQFRMLERIEAGGPHRTTDLALLSAISQPTASVAISTLENRGLVRRSVDETDRRASLIELTEEGRALLNLARERVLQRLITIVGDVTEEDALALAEIQRILNAGMDVAREARLAEKKRQPSERRDRASSASGG